MVMAGWSVNVTTLFQGRLIRWPSQGGSSFLAILDVACCYLWLFSLYINIKIGKVKKLLNVRLAGDHLYGKLLFTWLSLVVFMIVSFCAVLFPMRCLG